MKISPSQRFVGGEEKLASAPFYVQNVAPFAIAVFDFGSVATIINSLDAVAFNDKNSAEKFTFCQHKYFYKPNNFVERRVTVNESALRIIKQGDEFATTIDYSAGSLPYAFRNNLIDPHELQQSDLVELIKEFSPANNVKKDFVIQYRLEVTFSKSIDFIAEQFENYLPKEWLATFVKEAKFCDKLVPHLLALRSPAPQKVGAALK